MENIIYSWTTVLISTVHAAGTAMDSSDTTVIFGTVGGLVGLLLLIMASAVILGVCIRLCICRKRQKYKATGMSYNTVSVLWSIGRCSKLHAVCKSACIDAMYNINMYNVRMLSLYMCFVFLLLPAWYHCRLWRCRNGQYAGKPSLWRCACLKEKLLQSTHGCDLRQNL